MIEEKLWNLRIGETPNRRLALYYRGRLGWKALKLTQEGFPWIGIPGVWGFSKEKALLPDFNVINFKKRKTISKGELQSRITQMQSKLRETEARAERWLELTEKTFSFATYARKAFLMAKGKEGLELKKEILLALGKTPIIKDQKLFIEPNEWLAEIGNDYPALEKKYLRLEPRKMPMNKVKKEALASVRARWLGD